MISLHLTVIPSMEVRPGIQLFAEWSSTYAVYGPGSDTAWISLNSGSTSFSYLNLSRLPKPHEPQFPHLKNTNRPGWLGTWGLALAWVGWQRWQTSMAPVTMAVFHSDVEIKEFQYGKNSEMYFYPCPHGNKFCITQEDLANGETRQHDLASLSL